MFQYLLRLLPVFTLLLILPARTPAEEPAPAAAAAEAELREAIRKYDDALRRADVAGVEPTGPPSTRSSICAANARRAPTGSRTCARGGRRWTPSPTRRRRRRSSPTGTGRWRCTRRS